MNFGVEVRRPHDKPKISCVGVEVYRRSILLSVEHSPAEPKHLDPLGFDHRQAALPIFTIEQRDLLNIIFFIERHPRDEEIDPPCVAKLYI